MHLAGVAHYRALLRYGDGNMAKKSTDARHKWHTNIYTRTSTCARIRRAKPTPAMAPPGSELTKIARRARGKVRRSSFIIFLRQRSLPEWAETGRRVPSSAAR